MNAVARTVSCLLSSLPVVASLTVARIARSDMATGLSGDGEVGRAVASGTRLAWLVLACLLVPGSSVAAQSESRSLHTLPLVTSASNRVLRGVVRIINHSDRAGTVQIHAIDDAGQRFGPISLHLGAKASVNFNSDDLESGNRAKGLSGGVGDGDGDWRLELSGTLDIEPLTYLRTRDGAFLTSMHDLVVKGAVRHHQHEHAPFFHVPFFNPASNSHRVSRLRLVNPSETDARVEIYGLDDAGERSGDVHLTVPAGGARTVGAQELESGGGGLSGRLGDGRGKWRLFVSADRPIRLMNLLRNPTGAVANLSTSTAYRRSVDSLHTLPLVTSASNRVLQSVVRIINHSDRAGTVRIHAIDDAGRRFGPISFHLEAEASANFTSTDLESGNLAKGLSGGVGDGDGDWRLELSGHSGHRAARLPSDLGRRLP